MRMSKEEIQNLYSLANYVSIHVSPTDGRRIERAAEHIEFFQNLEKLKAGVFYAPYNPFEENEDEQTKEA